jgi:anti-sigma-K factor RskA
MFTAKACRRFRKARCISLWTIKGSVATVPVRSCRTQAARRRDRHCGRHGGSADAFGVTIEPAGGSATPTMPIVMVGGTK